MVPSTTGARRKSLPVASKSRKRKAIEDKIRAVQSFLSSAGLAEVTARVVSMPLRRTSRRRIDTPRSFFWGPDATTQLRESASLPPLVQALQSCSAMWRRSRLAPGRVALCASSLALLPAFAAAQESVGAPTAGAPSASHPGAAAPAQYDEIGR